MSRRIQNLLHAARFNHLSLIHKDNLVGHFAGEADFVRDHHHGHARMRQVFHHLQHFANQFRIEGGGRFIKQQHLWVHCQRAGDGDALLLAAGQFTRPGVDAMFQPDAGQQLFRPFLHLGFFFLFHPQRRVADVLQHGAVCKQVELLKYHANAFTLFGHLGFFQLVQMPAFLAPVVVMVGLEHKLIRPDTVLDTTPYRVNGHLIKDVGHWSKLTITGVLQKSSDIAVSHIALALPATVLPAVYRSFGLGRPTELGIGNESSGYLPQHRERWADIERATFSFGYGLRVTPLQMAREYAAIGSFGIYRPLSITKVTPPVMGQRILPADTVRSVVHMMESDALPGGSGVSAAVPGYRLAIKTGTAEKMGPSGKYDGGYINYTAGVAPASDPQVALVVMVNNPKAGKHFGGSVAGPVFGKIMAQVLEHMNILPDAQPLNVVSSVKS